MLKIIPVALATVPCILLPLMGSGHSFAHANYNNIDDQTPAEFSALGQCKPTDIELFFEGELMRFHTAEFLTDAIQTAKDCGDAYVEISPIKSENTFLNPHAENNVEEAILYLESHDVEYQVIDPIHVPADQDYAYNDGHTVSIRIIPTTDKSS
ncbi:MAG: hypothetical protein HKN36_04140 [Hellea sp.]|nr:hypothetical protein [Hellea sp.]